MYVDDVLLGADTFEELVEAQQQLKTMLSQGGFPIHKRCSNLEEFLKRIPIEARENSYVPLEEYRHNHQSTWLIVGSTS